MENNENDDENPLDRALGIPPLIYDHDSAIVDIVSNLNDDSALQDFKVARSNIHQVIENGTDAIVKLATIAEQSQNPRAYEVLGKLMDSVVNASDKLIDIQKKVKEIIDIEKPNTPSNVTNNLFVGSTTELQAMIEKMRK
jgi:hypothetical protein